MNARLQSIPQRFLDENTLGNERCDSFSKVFCLSGSCFLPISRSRELLRDEIRKDGIRIDTFLPGLMLSALYAGFIFLISIFKPEFVPVLEEGTAIIKSKPNMRVVLEGHTDSIGSEQYNMKLGQRRADALVGLKGDAESSLRA